MVNIKHTDYWGKPTSTIDWCEENYAKCQYIAEFWNTTTNLLYVILALGGCIFVKKNGLDSMFYLSYLSIAVVGLGSWLFHMTLQFKMQLLDELPMIYCASVVISHSFALQRNSSAPLWISSSLTVYSVLITTTYLLYPNPLFHEAAYGVLVTVFVLRSVYLLRAVPFTAHQKEATRKIFLAGIAGFVSAFMFWNIDNHFCEYLRVLRTKLIFPLDLVFQFHALWHIFTAVGAYYLVLFLISVRLASTDHLTEYHCVTLSAGLFPQITLKRKVAKSE